MMSALPPKGGQLWGGGEGAGKGVRGQEGLSAPPQPLTHKPTHPDRERSATRSTLAH